MELPALRHRVRPSRFPRASRVSILHQAKNRRLSRARVALPSASFRSWAPDPGVLVPIPGGISQADIIAFSPNGADAVLYSASQGQLQIVTGLPDNPQVTRNIGNAELPDAVRVLAIADDGLTLLEGTVRSAVYLLAASGPQALENVSDLGGILFNPKTTDALIFDRNEGTLSLLRVSAAHLPAARLLAA